LNGPTGLTFGTDGALYVTSRSINSVMRSAVNPDYYAVTLAAGQQFTVTSATPFDAVGQPVNTLDPRLELFNAGQNLVATGTGAGNEQIVYTAPSAGTYYLKVTAEGTTAGEYVLTLTTAQPLVAAAAGTSPTAAPLTLQEAQPLVAEAIRRWAPAGAHTSALAALDVRVADLGSLTLGLAAGNTIWLDDNAAGCGWFVDPTPADDGEFFLPGDQGERGRMDLLSVLLHEIGHVLGHDHDEEGVMAETLAAGIRVDPGDETAPPAAPTPHPFGPNTWQPPVAVRSEAGRVYWLPVGAFDYSPIDVGTHANKLRRV
jgi:hypothetical protein